MTSDSHLGRAMPAAGAPAMSVCVAFATRGRPDQLEAAVAGLAKQSLQPSSIIVSCASAADLGRVADRAGVTILFGQAGLARQRNAVLRALPEGADIVVFFDDDFVPHRDWLQAAVAAFASDPAVACVTGHVLADGVTGPGLTPNEAHAAIAGHDPQQARWVVEGYSPYGCNMAFRCSAIRGLSFDERLVLYGWLEDRDFGALVAQRGGRSIKIGSAAGVHLGVKDGRMPGRKLGYSQVMNPIYLRLKSSMTSAQMLRQMSRNIAANLVRTLSPEPYIDRRGRLAGNIIAALDVLRGRLTPERAESL